MTYERAEFSRAGLRTCFWWNRQPFSVGEFKEQGTKTYPFLVLCEKCRKGKGNQYFVSEYFAYRVLMAPELKRFWSPFISQRIKTLFPETCLPWSRVVSEWVHLSIFDDPAPPFYQFSNCCFDKCSVHLILQEPQLLHPEDLPKRIL